MTATPRTRPAPRRKKSKPKAASHRSLKPLIIVSTVIFFLLLISIVSLSYCLKSYSGPDSWVYIPADATEESISDSLASSLGPEIAPHVIRLWKINGGTPTASHGAYLIPSGMSAFRIGRSLAKGHQTPVKISWNEARDIGRIASRISRSVEADSAAVANAINHILAIDSVPSPLRIGVLIPDTYEVYWSATPESIVEKLYEHYKPFWDETRTSKARELGLSPAEIAIIASIAEEETADRTERGVVGRLYINRLAIGMPLQADPTVRYAIGDFTIRRVTGAHTRFESPYNTYLHRGLPPGPIRNPSASTIDSILSSAPHSYLYMCAKEDFSGTHNFAVDYETHRANAARYQAELNRRGIK